MIGAGDALAAGLIVPAAAAAAPILVGLAAAGIGVFLLYQAISMGC